MSIYEKAKYLKTNHIYVMCFSSQKEEKLLYLNSTKKIVIIYELHPVLAIIPMGHSTPNYLTKEPLR